MNIVLDIGGTKTRIGLVTESGKLLETSFFPTDKNFETGINNILNYIHNRDIRVKDICIGIAGVLDKAEGGLYSSPNMKGWIGKPIKKIFEKELSSNVLLENDAALAGLGESVYGSGKDYKIVAYLTIGTGVGGVRIVNKNIDEKVYGFEPGRMIFPHKTKDKEFKTSFESLISGKSINRIYGKTSENITDKSIWNEIIKNAAIGICNLIYFWTPNIVILGGGVSLSEFFDLNILEKKIGNILWETYPKIPELKKSALGDFSGIWGGIAYLMNNIGM